MSAPKFELASARFAIAYGALVLALFAIQAIMGANVIVAFSLVIASSVALIGAFKPQKTASNVIVWGIAFYFGFAGLFLKTINGQVVESNLTVPNQAAFSLMAATASIAVAFKLAVFACRGKNDILKIGEFFSSEAAVAACGIPLALISSIAYLAHQMLVKSADDPTGGGFGGFGSIYFLQNVSLAFLWAALAWTSRRRYLLALVGMMAFALVGSMLSNEKRILIDFSLVTIFSFMFIERLRRFWPLLAFIGLLAAPAVIFIVPAIQATRLEAKLSTPAERVQLVWDLLMQTGFDTSQLGTLSDKQTESYKYAFGPNLSYYYPVATNADRFSLIFPLDQVERRDNVPALSLFEQMGADLQRELPGFLVSKNAEVTGDRIAWQYGIRQYGSVARPVLGAPASAYALGGVLGLLILPGLAFFFVFCTANLVGGQLRNSPFAVSLGVIMVVMTEWTVPFPGYFIRSLPILIFTLMAIRWITYRLPSYQRWLARRAAGSSSFLLPSTSEAQTSASTASR